MKISEIITDKYKLRIPPTVYYELLADVVEAEEEQEPTGHWEWLTEDKYRCSNCNSETRVDECMNEPMYEFCPFCGARMVGDNNDR